MTIRVVIADDHTRTRGLIRESLESNGCVVCGEGSTAQEAIALAIEHRPDVALLDVHMPGSGIQAASAITRAAPEVAVVMLTRSAEEDDLFDALRAGAAGYLLKDADPGGLGDALRRVLAGEGALSPRLLSRILDEFRAPKRRRLGRKSPAADRLSAREWK
ncbi:response regulator transcription factor [Intrasporangium sp. DVR]|uniref:response regulator n=1 Tax=Intrasporangium sp. DVR TaxID=3127867 RepID=UPI003341BE08